jgi:2-C-methyl-D-erythritol 4-phosphate cytidylyltransferase
MRDIAVILPGAGSGKRFGGTQPKQFQSLGGRPILDRTVDVFQRAGCVAQIILAVPAGRIKPLQLYFQAWSNPPEILVVAGGATRQDSVGNALRQVAAKCRFVAVHDLVRPLLDLRLFAALMREARRNGAAIPALPVTDTLKRVDADGRVIETVARESYVIVQTPQVFRREILEVAHRAAEAQFFQGTDEAMLVERAGYPVCVVPGSRGNLKITLPEDLQWAEYYLEMQSRKTQ